MKVEAIDDQIELVLADGAWSAFDCKEDRSSIDYPSREDVVEALRDDEIIWQTPNASPENWHPDYEHETVLHAWHNRHRPA